MLFGTIITNNSWYERIRAAIPKGGLNDFCSALYRYMEDMDTFPPAYAFLDAIETVLESTNKVYDLINYPRELFEDAEEYLENQ